MDEVLAASLHGGITDHLDHLKRDCYECEHRRE